MASSERQPLTSPFHRGIAVPKPAKWASAISSHRDASRRIPQAIAHRGFKASFPENTMAAFRAAIDAGAHALETDAHLSKDGVVVLSHDPSLKRCFGVDLLIKDCAWAYLSSLRTVKEPHEPLPRLVDLLEYLVSGPETEKIWVLLDIKATFMKAALSHLPGFPLAHISISPFYSRHFLPIPNLAFNMFQLLLVGPLGKWFLNDAKRAARPVFAWTVNNEKWMEWCVRKNFSGALALLPSSTSSSEASSASSPSDNAKRSDVAAPTVLIDGVITDNPKLFLQVCSRVEDEMDGKTAIAPRQNFRVVLSTLRTHLGTTCGILLVNVFATSFFWYRRIQGRMDKFDSSFFRNFQA
ncbi:PLC-like phosphodiesterase [Trichoderma ceciliae]